MVAMDILGFHTGAVHMQMIEICVQEGLIMRHLFLYIKI